jgi:hypothetical protein
LPSLLSREWTTSDCSVPFGSVDEILEGELCQLLSDQGSNPYFLLVSEDIAVASDEHLGIEISEE